MSHSALVWAATNTSAHVQATSTGTSDVQTITVPANAKGCFICVETNAARVTFDGEAPGSTVGLVFPAGVAPVFVPMASTIKFVSTAAANSVVDVLWIS